MDRRIKKRWIALAIEIGTVFPLIVLGLIFNTLFILAAVFIWFGFTIYQSFIGPGGSW